MRTASFAVTGHNNQRAEITIIPLSGDGGGDIDNLNRWRAQVGLSPVGMEELAQSAEDVEIGGQRGRLFDICGPATEGNRARRLIAAIARRGEITWFFKMLGDDALVKQQKHVFIEFLRTVQYED